MYQAYGLLTSNSDFTLDAAATRLAAKLPAFTLERMDGTIKLSTADWEIHLTLNEGPQVAVESRDIAEGIAGRVDGGDIAACTRRVEVGSDIPDQFMEHFNDYLLVIEVLNTFKGLIAVDPQVPSLL